MLPTLFVSGFTLLKGSVDFIDDFSYCCIDLEVGLDFLFGIDEENVN